MPLQPGGPRRPSCASLRAGRRRSWRTRSGRPVTRTSATPGPWTSTLTSAASPSAWAGPLTLDAWIGALRAALTPLPEALGLAAAVGRRARIAVLTNNNLLVAREIDSIFPELRPIFGDNIFVSAQFRARKPDPEVYRRCLARLGAAPEAALFVDDSAKNVAGAEHAGLERPCLCQRRHAGRDLQAGRIAAGKRIAGWPPRVSDRRAAVDRRSQVSTRGARRAVRPFDDPARPKFGREVALAGRDPAAHGDAGLVHAVRRTRNERMPVEEIPSFGDKPIGASGQGASSVREPQPASISRSREPAGDAARNRGTGRSCASSSLQPTSVKWILPLSSSSSLTRQQRPQPSHKLSHSLALISSSVLARQNGVDVGSFAVIGSTWASRPVGSRAPHKAAQASYCATGILRDSARSALGRERPAQRYVRLRRYASPGSLGQWTFPRVGARMHYARMH